MRHQVSSRPVRQRRFHHFKIQPNPLNIASCRVPKFQLRNKSQQRQGPDIDSTQSPEHITIGHKKHDVSPFNLRPDRQPHKLGIWTFKISFAQVTKTRSISVCLNFQIWIFDTCTCEYQISSGFGQTHCWVFWFQIWTFDITIVWLSICLTDSVCMGNGILFGCFEIGNSEFTFRWQMMLRRLASCCVENLKLSNVWKMLPPRRCVLFTFLIFFTTFHTLTFGQHLHNYKHSLFLKNKNISKNHKWHGGRDKCCEQRFVRWLTRLPPT